VSDLHQDHEELDTFTDPDKKNPEVQHGSLFIIASLGALVVTVLATIAAVLGAYAANHESVVNRDRQLMAAYSGSLTSAQDVTGSRYQEWLDERSQYYWSARFLTSLSASSQDPGLKTQLESLGSQARTSLQNLQKSPPSAAADYPPNKLTECRESNDPPRCASELTRSYAAEASRWLAKERSYIAIVSLLAVALFLFALTRPVERRGMQKMFLWVASGIAMVAVIWMVADAVFKPVHQASSAGAIDIANGDSMLGLSNPVEGTIQQSDLARAVSDLRRATTESPELPDAWHDLGTAVAYDARGRFLVSHCAASEEDYARAVSLVDTPLDSIYENDLANEEFKCRDLGDASSNLREALQQNPRNSIALGSLAEEELIAGKSVDDVLSEPLYQAIVVAGWDGKQATHAPTHGPLWRTPWFASLRSDESALREIGVPEKKLNVFFNAVVGAEGELMGRDIVGRYDQDQLRSQAITSINENQGAPIVADTRGDVTYPGEVFVDIGYSGLRKGDLITVAWYTRCSDVFVPCSYLSDTVPTAALSVGTGDGHYQSGVLHQGSGVLALGPFFPQSANDEIDVTVNGQALRSTFVNVGVQQQ
jgi:hypothetical protein